MRLFLIAIVLLSAPAAHAVCPEAIPTAGSLQCGDVYTASLDHEQTSVFGQDCDQGLCYGCNAVVANQAGPEVAWTLVCPSPGSVMLRLTELSCDIDIYILEESCDPTEACVVSSILMPIDGRRGGVRLPPGGDLLRADRGVRGRQPRGERRLHRRRRALQP